MTVLKNGPCSDRRLIPALAAKPMRPTNRPASGFRTPWTDPSAGPAQCREVFNTEVLGAKTPLQLQQSPRIILVHGPKHYILGLVASSKYPYGKLIYGLVLARTATYCMSSGY